MPAPSSRSTRRCFSPQRPRPTSRTSMVDLVADELVAEVLGNFVAQDTGLHPAHDEQVRGGPEDAVEHAVLGLAEAARPVAHRHLEHAIAAHLEQRRDEAVEAAIEDEAAQALAAKGAERTAAVPDDVVAEAVAHAVGDPRGQPPQEGVAVTAAHAPAGDRVPLLQVAQQEPHTRIRVAQAAKELRAAIAAAVVHEHSLEVDPLGVEHDRSSGHSTGRLSSSL